MEHIKDLRNFLGSFKLIPVPIIYLTSIMLFIAIAPLPYGYYTILRIITTGVFLWSSFIMLENNESILPWVFILLAIIFNPILKVYFPKEIWAVIDIFSGLLIFVMRNKYMQY